MSHFSVLVRVPASVEEHKLENAIAVMMLPYKEAGCGSSDPAELEKFLTFHDEEEEYRQSYATETCNMVRLADGRLVCAYDEECRNPAHSLLGDEPQYKTPAGATAFEMPLKERYPTFEQYMADYCGYEKRDPKTGRYGHWQNPQAKWDWWTIGGRWTGKLSIGYDPAKDPVNYKRCWICNGSGSRPGTHYGPEAAWARKGSPAGHPVIGNGCNACYGTGQELKFASEFKPVGNYLRAFQLDWQAIEAKARERLEEFWNEWQDFIGGKDFPAFEGPRDTALALGLVECKDNSELTGSEWKVIPWGNGRERCDVLKPTTREWLETRIDYFSPISTWARLGADGWNEKGEMGWFGCGSDTPESNTKHVSGMNDWIKNGDPRDWLVVVDCHI